MDNLAEELLDLKEKKALDDLVKATNIVAAAQTDLENLEDEKKFEFEKSEVDKVEDDSGEFFDPVKIYFGEISKLTLLSSEQEHQMTSEIDQSYLGLVRSICRYQTLEDEFLGLDKLSQLVQVKKDFSEETVRSCLGFIDKAKRLRSQIKARGKTRNLRSQQQLGLTYQAIFKVLSTDGTIVWKERLQTLSEKLLTYSGLTRHKRKLREARGKINQKKSLFVESNLRLVVAVAKRYNNRGLPFMDCIQEGNLGLMKAVDKYDPKMGNKFSTYAVWWIRQSISRAVENSGRNVRLPVHFQQRRNKIGMMERYFRNHLGRNPTPDEVCDSLDLPRDRYDKLKQMGGELYLDRPKGDEENSGTYKDALPYNGKGPLSKVLDANRAERLNLAMGRVLRNDEIDILNKRFGLNGSPEFTLEEVGNHPNHEVTRERIRQKQACALAKLERFLRKDGLQLSDYL